MPSDAKKKLLDSLMVQYGLPGNVVTLENLDRFLAEFRRLIAATGSSRAAWRQLTARISEFFPGAGTWKYGAQDHTDLQQAAEALLAALGSRP